MRTLFSRRILWVVLLSPLAIAGALLALNATCDPKAKDPLEIRWRGANTKYSNTTVVNPDGSYRDAGQPTKSPGKDAKNE